MPELPEVETVARGLDRRVKGDVIESVWLGSKPEPLKSPAAEIAQTLEGKKISGVRRVGKHIVIVLELAKKTSADMRYASQSKKAKKNQAAEKSNDHAQWIVHLGMTGRMLVCEADEEIAKHTHAIAKLKSGRELRFVDPRRFGRLSVTQGFEAAGT